MWKYEEYFGNKRFHFLKRSLLLNGKAEIMLVVLDRNGNLRHILKIMKAKSSSQMVHFWRFFSTRCLPITFTMFVHVSERENFFTNL